MAQKNSGDLFNFVIEPQFDTSNIKDDSKILENELKKVAERISIEIADKLGDAFNFPKNFDMSDITQVLQLVSQLGGELSRTGTNISAAFKDADGNIVKVTGSIEDAIGKLETLRKNELSQAIKTGSKDAADAAKQQLDALSEYQKTGMVYTGTDQIKEQNELEQQIIKSIQEQYNLEKKIQEAKVSNNSVNETYYTGLQNIAKQEEANYQTNYKGSQTRIDAIRNELEADQQLYNAKLQNQEASKKAAQDEQNNLKQSLELLNQYESVKSKIDSAETSGQKGSAYYQELEKQLNDIITAMQTYGIEIDKTTGKLVFKDTATNAVKAKENVDKLNKGLKETNTNLDTQQAKAKDQTLINSIKEYVKQYKTLQSLESSGKKDTQAYKDTQTAIQGLVQTLKQYGIELQTNTNGVSQFVVVQKTQENQTDKVTSALRELNIAMLGNSDNQNKLTNSIQQSVENFIKYQVVMEAINKITSEFTSAIYDMNEAMTQVRMVTMGSYEDTVALADSYTQLAKQLGTTTTTVAEGADAWLRQGYNAQDAMEMLKQSTTLAVVGQLDASEATDQLTA